MKLSKHALLEIVAILQEGLTGNKDISQALRELDLVPKEGAILSETDEIGKLTLSQEYLATHPRVSQWTEN